MKEESQRNRDEILRARQEMEQMMQLFKVHLTQQAAPVPKKVQSPRGHAASSRNVPASAAVPEPTNVNHDDDDNSDVGLRLRYVDSEKDGGGGPAQRAPPTQRSSLLSAPAATRASNMRLSHNLKSLPAQSTKSGASNLPSARKSASASSAALSLGARSSIGAPAAVPVKGLSGSQQGSVRRSSSASRLAGGRSSSQSRGHASPGSGASSISASALSTSFSNARHTPVRSASNNSRNTFFTPEPSRSHSNPASARAAVAAAADEAEREMRRQQEKARLRERELKRAAERQRQRQRELENQRAKQQARDELTPEDLVHVAGRSFAYMNVSIEGEHAGTLVIMLFDEVVPKTVANFRALCSGEYGQSTTSGLTLHYKNSRFHRVLPGFIMQGGDIADRFGMGSESIYGSVFRDENFKIQHDRPGMVSMANRGAHTNGSQFFITAAAQQGLDGRHVCFGRVVKGMDVVFAIDACGRPATGKPTCDIRVSRCGVLDGPAVTQLVEEMTSVRVEMMSPETKRQLLRPRSVKRRQPSVPSMQQQQQQLSNTQVLPASSGSSTPLAFTMQQNHAIGFQPFATQDSSSAALYSAALTTTPIPHPTHNAGYQFVHVPPPVVHPPMQLAPMQLLPSTPALMASQTPTQTPVGAYFAIGGGVAHSAPAHTGGTSGGAAAVQSSPAFMQAITAAATPRTPSRARTKTPGKTAKSAARASSAKRATAGKVATVTRLAPSVSAASNPLVFFDVAVNGRAAGRFVILLRSDIAPRTCDNFRHLCMGVNVHPGTKDTYGYSGSTIHKIYQDFLIQGGDITSQDGYGGRSSFKGLENNGAFEDENFILKHDVKGVVSMANAGPNTNTSQFMILATPAPWLDGLNVVFGRVVEGIQLIDLLNKYSSKDGTPLARVEIVSSGSLESF
jgi:peptidylprolyl isomerase